MWYTLDENNKPVASNVREYSAWEEANPERKAVKQDTIGEVFISTVFLGLDHSWRDDRRPLLWETMVFGGDHDQYQQRYYSYEDAIEGHQTALDLVNK
jgi:hypothetical protein